MSHIVSLLLLAMLAAVHGWSGLPCLPRGISKKLGQVGVAASLLVNSPLPSLAAPLRLFSSPEQSLVDELSDLQRPVVELADQLKPTLQPNPVGVYLELQVLKDGKDDSDVVLLYSEKYIKPLQAKMALVAPKIAELAKESSDKERIALLPQLMKGHILELAEAIKRQKASEELKEVQEVQETLSEFLLQASKVGLEVQPFIPTRPLSDKELFGPLGCEWWGRKRVEGSNACTTVE
jgi:hypothetical protein